MSTLQFLREKAGVLVAGVIGLSLFLFVVSDFFGRGRGTRIQQKKRNEIGRINGEYISYIDYEQRVQNLQEIYKLSGTTNIDEATAETIREQMWQQMVREKILDSHYDNLGIGVSTEELEELVMGNEPHPIVQQLFTDRQTGQFNKSFLVNFLKSIEVDETAKKYWLFFEDEIVADRMNSKYNSLITKGLYVTSKQAEFEGNLAARTVDFSYALKNYMDVSDSTIKVSENEIKAYYASHKENYKRTAQRDIEYVTFDIIPSADDIASAEKWINNTKTEFAEATDPVQYINSTADNRHTGLYFPLSGIPDSLKAFVKKENTKEVFGPYLEDGSYKLARLLDVSDRPDSVHARHILLSPKQNLTLEQVRLKADSLVKVLKSGVPFQLVAMTNSEDQGSAQLGGDLGWFSEGRMVVPFNNACFTAKKGVITTVETDFGIHIIEVLDQSKKSRKYEVGIVDRKILASSVTSQRAYTEASKFAGTVDNYEKFTKAIADQKLTKRVANNVTPLQKTIPGFENPRLLIMSLFSAEQGKIVQDASEQAVFDIEDKYIVAYCTKVIEDGIAPEKDVRDDIRFSIIRDKKAEIITAKLNSLKAEAKSLEDITSRAGINKVSEAAQITFRSFSVEGAAGEPAIIGAASMAEQGVVSGPVKGNNGVYLLTVNNVVTAPSEDIKLLKDRLITTFQMRGTYEAYESLKKSANVIDKRYKFY
jgi:peptidyl-prolyl cis-trans isomerase D